MSKLVCQLLAQRCRSLSWHDMFPGRLALLLSSTPSLRDEAMRSLRAAEAAYQAAVSSGAPFWKAIASRSVMGHVRMRQVVAMCKAAGWTVTGSVQELLQRTFGGCSQTKLVEDAFNLHRRSEISGNSQRKMSTERTWAVLLEKKLASSLHHFDEGALAEQALAGDLRRANLDSLCQVAPAISSAYLREIVGQSSKASFHSPAPAMAVQDREELAMVLHAHENKCWDLVAKHSWLSILFNGENLAVSIRWEMP